MAECLNGHLAAIYVTYVCKVPHDTEKKTKHIFKQSRIQFIRSNFKVYIITHVEYLVGYFCDLIGFTDRTVYDLTMMQDILLTNFFSVSLLELNTLLEAMHNHLCIRNTKMYKFTSFY